MKPALSLFFLCLLFFANSYAQSSPVATRLKSSPAVKHDVSSPLRTLRTEVRSSSAISHRKDTIIRNAVKPPDDDEEAEEENAKQPSKSVIGEEAATIEQTVFGTKSAPILVTSFDGLGEGFVGPQGTAILRNPSDNSLSVGMDHVVQIVNSRMAIFTKKGKKYNESGRVLYGPVETRNVFRGFGGPCEKMNNGDAVVRYDQLADRWLIVMPTFRRGISRNVDSATGKRIELIQPGKAETLFQPPPPANEPGTITPGQRPSGQRPPEQGTYCMCYAISTSSDPMGSYYRYEFERELFPDYPRPTVWPDGYYTTTSTGDNVIEKHAYVVDRNKMLKGENAKEQSFIIKDVNFLINADLDGKQLPPVGAPSIMLAAGGSQLNKVLEDDGIYVWKYHVDWNDFSKTKIEGPVKIRVAPYHYMGDGQLTKAVPQPGTDIRLDAQGDKLMARLVYRRIGNRESIVGLHSINTSAGGGGVRWYEFLVTKTRDLSLYQQGTYAPGGNYRWLGSAAIDGKGNIGIGYSFGGESDFPGQRFTGRHYGDPLGKMTMNEIILAKGEAAQTNTLRWEDYTQTAIDPSDDETIWYVGDYLKKDAKNYSSKIGAFKLSKAKALKK
ncbi:MAG: hypothetical protein V4450_07875 [Bacteroidota bacterium]